MQRAFKMGTAVAVAAVVALTGCQQSSVDTLSAGTEGDGLAEDRAEDYPSAVGTISIQRLFLMLGLQQQRVAKQQELRQRMDREKEEKEASVEAKLKELGGDRAKLDDDQKKELAALEVECIRSLQNTQREVREELNSLDAYLNNLFSHKTRGPIQEVAERRKLDVVLIVQANAFAYARPGVDITDEVLTEIGPLPNLKAAPKPPTDAVPESDPSTPEAEGETDSSPAKDAEKDAAKDAGASAHNESAEGR